jgi:hypothetical protein
MINVYFNALRLRQEITFNAIIDKSNNKLILFSSLKITLSWHIVMAHYHGTLSSHFIMAHCHGTSSRHIVMAHCHGTLSWNIVMAHYHGTLS